MESMDHDGVESIDLYEELARNLGADDPVRSEALFWLGQAHYTRGHLDPAREALRECVRTGGARERCLELLGQLELEESSITTLPVRWTFDDTDHGVLHPWRYADQGSVRLETDEDGDGELAWTTNVDVQREDRLFVGFRSPSPSPRTVQLHVAAERFDATIRIDILDIYGHRFTALPGRGFVEVPTGAPRTISLTLSEATAEDGDRGAPLDPAQLDRLEIVDVTARYGTRIGENVLHIDDFEVR